MYMSRDIGQMAHISKRVIKGLGKGLAFGIRFRG